MDFIGLVIIRAVLPGEKEAACGCFFFFFLSTSLTELTSNHTLAFIYSLYSNVAPFNLLVFSFREQVVWISAAASALITQAASEARGAQ